MNLQKLVSKPKVFERIFGISPQEFKQLAIELKPLWNDTEIKRKERTNRKHAIGGGRIYKLSFEQSLAMYLLYLRSYAPYVFIGFVFHIDDGSVTRYFQKLRPVLALRMKKLVIKQVPLTQEEILALIVDATEQETEKRDGSGYSGKKKRQSIKTQIIVTTRGDINHVSLSVPGNRHDKRLYDDTGYVAGRGDLGYLGTGIVIPKKASKLHPLTEEQKKSNKEHARVRIVVEHVFASLKQFRILSQRFRNRLSYYNQIFLTICGLYSLRRS